MAYTFGAGVTNNVQTTGLTASFTTNRVTFVSCWVYPTTLTATRCIWANGAIFRLAVDTTTTSCRFSSDNTTDGAFTFPAGLAVNTWTYIAVLVNCGTGPTMAVKAWVGTESTPPIEQTVTVATTPVGAFTSGGSTFTIGNTNAGSLAFQGDIGGLVLFTDSTNSNLNTICSIAANGATTQAQANQVQAAFVDPLWRGDALKLDGMGRMVINGALLGLQMALSLDNSVSGGAWAIRANSAPVRSTVTGATASARQTPHSFDDSPNNLNLRRRRLGYSVRV